MISFAIDSLLTAASLKAIANVLPDIEIDGFGPALNDDRNARQECPILLLDYGYRLFTGRADEARACQNAGGGPPDIQKMSVTMATNSDKPRAWGRFGGTIRSIARAITRVAVSKPMEACMSSFRKAVICVGLLVGAALMFGAQNMMALEAGATVENFSAFLHRVEDNEVKEVTYTGRTGIVYVTRDGKKFVTTAPPAAVAYEGLTNRLIERDIVVRATDSN
jgi:hypothetical protein